MAICDIVLQLNSYPEPTPCWAIDAAAYVAERLDANLSAGLCQVTIPDVSNFLSQLLVRSRDVIASENQKSAHNATQLLLKVEAAVPLDRRGETIVIDCPALVTPWHLAIRARAYDMAIVPSYGHAETSAIIESLVFDSGRPVILLPPEGAAGHRFESLLIAWDGSRAAARAMGDSLPLCVKARNVAVVAVTGEKDLRDAPTLADAVRHLARHGIEADAFDIAADGVDAGAALMAHCRRMDVDLLVMCAYGHTRAREFVLGGATRTVLKEADLPVLLSH